MTHSHRDHSPLAVVLAAATGARLIGLPPPGDGRQDATFQPALAGLESASLNTLTPLVYDDIAADRHAWAALTLAAHLIKLRSEGRVVEDGGSWHAIATRRLQ